MTALRAVVVIGISSLLVAIGPLALMYAILRRHVIGVRFAISRTVVCGVITAP